MLEIKDLIRDLGRSSGVTVALGWVKGHDDDTGNELADYLAKEGGPHEQDGARQHPGRAHLVKEPETSDSGSD